MAKKISVTSIVFILLLMVCITTQKKTEHQVKCDKLLKRLKNRPSNYDRIVKNLKKESCEKIPVDGVWEEWIETTTCTVTCGGGTKAYSRKCIKPQHGGKTCEGDASKTDICGEEECPVDGVWEEWIETTTCTVTCGGGTKAYLRKCIKPQHGGKACEGDESKTDICGEEECPDTWKQCDNSVTVARNVFIPWNPDSETITVTTDSAAGSGAWVDVVFYDKNGDYAGAVYIVFYTPIQYYIEWCIDGWTPFPVTLPTATQKTWTITYNYTERRVVYYCNGVQVLNVVLSDSACADDSWKYYWYSRANLPERKPTQIKFDSRDTASDSYCIASNTGAI